MKYVHMTDALFDYLRTCHSHSGDQLLEELRAETAQRFGGDAMMQINEVQGSLLSILVAATGTRRAIEVGTFTGASSLAIARALPDDGGLLCLDLSEEWTAVARRYWERAGVAEHVQLQLGDAVASLRALPRERAFDFAFVDAEKTDYGHYFDELLPRMRPNGLLVFDNALRGGAVLDPAKDPGTTAIDELNRRLATDERVETVLVPVSDGLLIARVRAFQ